MASVFAITIVHQGMISTLPWRTPLHPIHRQAPSIRQRMEAGKE